jgi:hypothetical protein
MTAGESSGRLAGEVIIRQPDVLLGRIVAF